jgi:DNA-binding NarL/FixJ family response regulator
MRIILADDQQRVRSALRLLLEQEPDIQIVGEVAEATSLLSQVSSSHANLVLLDWELPGWTSDGSPLQAEKHNLDHLRRLVPTLVVVALSGQPQARAEALAAGADAFVSKGDPPERLLGTINRLRKQLSHHSFPHNPSG